MKYQAYLHTKYKASSMASTLGFPFSLFPFCVFALCWSRSICCKVVWPLGCSFFLYQLVWYKFVSMKVYVWGNKEEREKELAATVFSFSCIISFCSQLAKGFIPCAPSLSSYHIITSPIHHACACEVQEKIARVPSPSREFSMHLTSRLYFSRGDKRKHAWTSLLCVCMPVSKRNSLTPKFTANELLSFQKTHEVSIISK